MPVTVDHVHLIVTDIPGTVAWFKENFGSARALPRHQHGQL